MSETVEETSPQAAAAANDAGATKSALKSNTARQRRGSARKVVISDNPMNATGKSGTMRTMAQTGNTENAQKST